MQRDKVTLEEYRDMVERYRQFLKKNGREPHYIRTPRGDTTIPLQTFKDMRRRYDEFKAQEGREPKVIYMTPKNNTKPKPKPPASDGWVTTGYYQQDYQDTDHTCGPSSLQMALSALGCQVNEAKLAKAAGTLNSGTPHKGMLKAVQYASKECKKKLKAEFKYFNSLGWGGIVKHIQAGGEVVLHVVTRPGLDTDINGRIIWKGSFGHYVYLVGVNQKKGQVRVADPTKGVVTFNMKGVEQAMRNWPRESLLLLSAHK